MSDAAYGALGARVTILEQELGKVRESLHRVINKVSELDVLYQESGDALQRIDDKVDAMHAKIDPMIATVAVASATQANHTENCLRDKERDRRTADQRHTENLQSLDRMDTRLRRVEWLYSAIAAAAVLISSLGLAARFVGHG